MFATAADPDYQTLLALVNAGKDFLEKENPRFDMAHFRPRGDWVREMARYGVLPTCVKREEVTDVYTVESDYWKSLWYQPPETAGGKR